MSRLRVLWNISKEKALGIFISPNGIIWILSGQQQLLEVWVGRALRAIDKEMDNIA